MTDPDRQSDDQVKPAQGPEPVVSKPYIMPDDPETGSVEALAKEAAESRDKMLRTLGKWKTCASAPCAKSPMRAFMASPVSRATSSISPTICSVRSMRFRPRP